MHHCHVCERDFNNSHDLNSHLNSRKHAQHAQPARCHFHLCGKSFGDEHALSQHLRSQAHKITQFHCCDCDRDFVHEEALLQHLRDKVHKPKPRAAPSKSVSCDLCGKSFHNQSSLGKHKASPAHKPLCAPLRCLGSQECGRSFTSPSSMILHLESGTCVSGITRGEVNELVVLQDMNHLITSPVAAEILEATPGTPPTPSESWAILTPSSSSLAAAFERSDSWSNLSGASRGRSPTPNISSCASGGASPARPVPPSWFLCPLCPPASNRFKTAGDLERHSLSPAHAPKIFHCPPVLLGGKHQKPIKTFSTLSGVAMHMESGACNGGKKALGEMVNFVNKRLQELGFLQIRLLGDEGRSSVVESFGKPS